MQVEGLIISAPRSVERRQISVPEPGESDVVVRVEFCGLCTPEQRVYRGTRATYPYWGGHELSGVVESLSGATTASIKVGDRVAIALMRRCGECRACRIGLDNHCAYLRSDVRLGLPRGPGGLTDCIVVPPYKVFPLPSNLSPHQGALVEPVACVMHSIDRAQARPGELAAVIGAGTMGLIHAVLLALRGCRVHVFDDDVATHKAATATGACLVGPFSILSDSRNVLAWTDEWGFDLVFCTRFGARALDRALTVVARGGRVVLYQSITEEDSVAVSANDVHYREIQIIGTVAQRTSDVLAATGVLATHSERFRVLHTEIMPSDQPTEAFERALDPKVNRVILDFRA